VSQDIVTEFKYQYQKEKKIKKERKKETTPGEFLHPT
jgi:hypothetical protein